MSEWSPDYECVECGWYGEYRRVCPKCGGVELSPLEFDEVDEPEDEE